MRINGRQVFIILIVAMLVFMVFWALAGRAFAQDATPASAFDNINPPNVDAFDEAPPAPSDNPAWDALLTYSLTVAGFVQVVKPLIDRLRLRTVRPDGTYAWSDDVHTFLIRLVAVGAALAVIFLTRSRANVLDVLGIVVDVPLWVAQLLTAIAIGFGSSFLWALFRLFKNLPAPPPVVVMNQPEVNTTVRPPTR